MNFELDYTSEINNSITEYIQLYLFKKFCCLDIVKKKAYDLGMLETPYLARSAKLATFSLCWIWMGYQTCPVKML